MWAVPFFKPLVALLSVALPLVSRLPFLNPPLTAEPLTAQSKLGGSRVSLRESAKRFQACISYDDINLPAFAAATEHFVSKVETFGDFTARGVHDARSNLRKVEQARGGRIKSMRALLMDQIQRGARLPSGGPARASGAEALIWARLGISFWVELFKEHLRTRGKASLPEATRSGFQRSLARYFDRFGRAAFSVAARSTPQWEDVRARSGVGCSNGVCSDETLNDELRSFVKEVEPVLERMTKLHKSVGLEDVRTP